MGDARSITKRMLTDEERQRLVDAIEKHGVHRVRRASHLSAGMVDRMYLRFGTEKGGMKGIPVQEDKINSLLAGLFVLDGNAHEEKFSRSRNTDVTLVLTPDLRDQLDEYAKKLEAQSPGVKVSRSAAARQILMRALGGGES